MSADLMDDSGLPSNIIASIQHHVGRSIVPMMYSDKNGVNIIGTGTLIHWKGHKLIIGAGHSLESDPMIFVPLYNIFGFSNQMNDQFLIDAWRIVITPRSEDDLCVIDVSRSSFGRRSDDEYHFIDIENVKTDDASPGWYFLIGYPQSAASNKGDFFTIKPITAVLDRFPGAPDGYATFRDGVDIYFRHDKKTTAVMPDGKRIVDDSIRLEGISGTSIWKCGYVAPNTVWHPSLTLSVVGVQVSCRHGSYIRATSWNKVMELLNACPWTHAEAGA